MINQILVSMIIGGCVITLAELLRIKKIISNESSRKVLHLTHGLVVTVWVFIATYSFIVVAELLFLLVVLGARYLKIMQPLRTVSRRSWGDIFFPLGIIGVACLSPSKEIFLVAMLELAVADALAALIGRRFTKGEYHIFRQRKTIAGTATFLITSVVILYLVRFLSLDLSYTMMIALVLMTTLAENFSPYGSDNLTIPLVVVVVLSFYTPAIGL